MRAVSEEKMTAARKYRERKVPSIDLIELFVSAAQILVDEKKNSLRAIAEVLKIPPTRLHEGVVRLEERYDKRLISRVGNTWHGLTAEGRQLYRSFKTVRDAYAGIRLQESINIGTLNNVVMN